MEILKIRSIDDEKNIALFRLVSSQVYKDDPVWSPASEKIWFQRFQQLNQEPDAFVLPIIATEKGIPVARCMIQRDSEALDENGKPQGAISFFEFLQGFQDIAKELLAYAEEILRQNDAQSILMPKSNNFLGGLLVSGFELPHFIYTNHNPDYYFNLLKDCGYLPKTRMITYYFTRETTKNFSLKMPHLKTREFDRKNLDREIDIFHFLQKKIFEGRSGYVMRSFQQDSELINSFLPFLEDDFVIIAETPQGDPVGLLVCMPDIYQLSRGEEINQARIISIGAIPKYTNKGAGVLMGAHLMRNLLKNTEYMRVEGSLVLSHNKPVHNLVKRFGAQPGKEYWILEKKL